MLSYLNIGLELFLAKKAMIVVEKKVDMAF